MDAPRTISKPAGRLLLWQVFLLVAVWGFMVLLHADNDGLWWQGDAPRHATTGIFYWDLLTSLPANPIDFALRFYARYPFISPGIYPPFFHILEGVAYGVFGISPYAPKMLVLAFLLLTGFYLLAWLRRWLGIRAGWAASLLFFIPDVILLSHSILLNVPAMALCLAGLYHARRWIEEWRPKQLYLTVLFVALATSTIYQGAIDVLIIGLWIAADPNARNFLKRKGILPLSLLILALLLCVWAAHHWAPELASWVIPQWYGLADLSQWTYYATMMPEFLGTIFLIFSLIGLLAGMLSPRWRKEAKIMMLWLITIYLVFSLMPAKDHRYILLMAPALIILSTLGIRVLVESARVTVPSFRFALWVGGLLLVGWLCVLPATRWAPPKAEGFREIAAFFKKQAPNEAILFDGLMGGVFGYFICSQDRQYHQRVVLADQLLYPGPWWEKRSLVNSAPEVLEMIKRRSGCRWLAIEMGPQSECIPPQAYLRRAVMSPECELVRSFPIEGHNDHRVDIYRLRVPVEPVEKVDVTFSLLGGTAFKNVQPITR